MAWVGQSKLWVCLYGRLSVSESVAYIMFIVYVLCI